MGKQGGLGLHLISVSVFLFAASYTCLGDRNMSVVCSEKERLALLKFKHSVEDRSGMLSSWDGNDCCLWEGIHCDTVTGNVESLYLVGDDEGYILGNEVNSSLAELRHLKSLDLSGNNFQLSHIPKFIGSLKQLMYLNLSNAVFGFIIPPHIGNLSNLKVLDLSSNVLLMVDDMAWTFGLSSLEHLDLSGIPLRRAQNRYTVFYMIPSLKELNLRGCSLFDFFLAPSLNSSRILPNIKHLDLGFTSFRGPLPGFLQNMSSSLTFLDLSNFNLSLSSSFANLLNTIPSLSELHLSLCGLDKTHLSSQLLNFSTLSNIQHLVLSYNSIHGTFPSIFTNMSSLRVLDLSGNMLNSSIPVVPNLLDLDLSFNQLTGPIPAFLGNLSKLDLSVNQLIGPIPAFLGNLSKLDLSVNQLIGSIPESIGNLAALTYLDLSSNRLTGPIPTSIGRLISLQLLRVSSNLLNETIPVSVGQLSELRYLDFSNNSLEGVVSEAYFDNLSMLKYLDASSNTKLIVNVSRDWIPPFQLVNLRLASCNIANEFPQWLRNQRKLKELVLSNASISGPLPAWLGKMPFIPQLDLSHNKLDGPLTNLPNGETYGRSYSFPTLSLLPNYGETYGRSYSFPALFLEYNFFNESIPRSLCRRTNLDYLDLSRNRLTGKIPKCLGNLQWLYGMILSSNHLSGVIPSFNAFSSLRRLNLNDNELTGELPPELGNLRFLTILDVGDNKFSGNIPEWVGEKLFYLVVLRLHKNNFSGSIPQSLCKASKLQILDVAHNNLKGYIPRCLGQLNAMVNEGGYRYFPPPSAFDFDENVDQVLKGVNLEYTTTWNMVLNMDLSSNKLVGEIPVELTALSVLVGLNLSNNHLSGYIPDTIGNMAALNSLDLSRNELTGVIPTSMAALTFLSHLNLSYNNLSGRIPTGSQLQTLIDPSIYEGNKDLCGPPLPRNCSNPEDPKTTITSKKKHEAADVPTKVWLFSVDMICGFATGFWGVIGVLFFKKQWRWNLFTFVEETMNLIHVAVVVRVSNIKRGREAA